jgi:hypothetical protein
VAPAAALIPPYALKYLKRIFVPTVDAIIRERELLVETRKKKERGIRDVEMEIRQEAPASTVSLMDKGGSKASTAVEISYEEKDVAVLEQFPLKKKRPVLSGRSSTVSVFSGTNKLEKNKPHYGFAFNDIEKGGRKR